MNTNEPVIYGERLADLVPVLVEIGDNLHHRADGSYRISTRMAPEAARPFRRALLRAEAALILEEVERGALDVAERPSEQRRADALVRLVTACRP